MTTNFTVNIKAIDDGYDFTAIPVTRFFSLNLSADFDIGMNYMGSYNVGTVTDSGTNTFATFEEATAYYYDMYGASIISAANTFFAGFSVDVHFNLGPLVFVDDNTQNQLNLKANITDVVPKTTTINGHALSSNITLTASDVGGVSSTDLSTAIAALVNSAPGTLDTLGEIATALSADESTAVALATTVGNKVDKISGKGLSTNDYTTAEKNKLANAVTAYFGTTLVTNPIIYTKSIAISSGTAVFQLTTDGTSTGTAVFPNGPNMDSIQAFVNDATASYQMGYALTNSNKTLTITCNKLSTANILTGILGQAAAPNGTSIKLTIMGS